MTNGEFVSSVINDNKLLNKDSHISRRHVLFIGKSKSKALLAQRMDEFKLTRQYDLISTIPCFEMSPVDWQDCGIFEFQYCRNIMKSVKKLPETVGGRTGLAIYSVSSVDGETIYSETTAQSFSNLKKRKYVYNKSNYYIVEDGYIILPDDTNELLTVKLIAIDKDEVDEASCCGKNDKNCTSIWDKEFICTDYLLENVRAQTVQEIASIYTRISEDENPNMDENQKSATVK